MVGCVLHHPDAGRGRSCECNLVHPWVAHERPSRTGAEALELTAQAYPQALEVLLAHRVTEETFDLLGERPTIFFALVTLARALNLPPGGAIALFALGRTIGWIGHSIEQYQANQVIRPRARYIGPPLQR